MPAHEHDETVAPTQDSASTPPAHAANAGEARRAEREQRRLAQAERAAIAKARRQSRGPGAWRTVVRPVLFIVVLALIAAALGKLAFFPDREAETQGDQVPTAELQEPTVVATIGTVRNDLELDGQVLPDATATIRSTQAGTISRVVATNGAQVAKGDPLYVVRVETPSTTVNPDGTVPAPTVKTFTISAPIAGVLTDFEVLVNQEVQVATETGAVQPPTFHVDAQLTAEQQYRLTTQPTEAQVQITDGPAPFTCTNLVIVQPGDAPATTSDPTTESGGGSTASQATLRCQIPSDVRAFTGLATTVTVAGGVAENVVTLPVTSVLGTADTGRVVRVADDGTQEEVEVGLGLSDGEIIQITSGLAEGEQVLEIVPGDEPDECSDPTTYDPAVCGVGDETTVP